MAGSIPSSTAAIGLEVGEVVLLLDPGIAAELRRLRPEPREAVGWNCVREDDPRRGAQPELVLERRELVVVRGRADDSEAPGGEHRLVRAVGEREVEAAALREPA